MASTVQSTCMFCKNDFLALTKEINRGNGKFCSRSCSGRGRKGKPPNVECAYCGLEFYKNVSQKSNSKSGLFFCCREHKDLAQRINGIEEIQPHHYGDGYRSYRKIAFRSHPRKCNRCEFNEVTEVLEVHHVDRNRRNNKSENLEVICPTCHRVEHYKAGDGSYSGITGL